jgi:uncharacterized protein (TIGR03437 family)
LGISVALQAPSFSGDGVFLNPVGVVNAASSSPFTSGIARGELITLYGTNLAPDTAVAPDTPFPSILRGVQVMINNRPAPIYVVSPTQLSVLVPYATEQSIAQIQVINNGVSSNPVSVFVNLTAPGVYTSPAGGLGYAAALHSDFTLVTPSSPASVGEIVSVYVTGLGDVNPSVPDGTAGLSDPLSFTTSTFTAFVNGISAPVYFAGLAPQLTGIYQLNVQIPAGVTAGDVTLDISGPDSYTSEALITVKANPSATAIPKTAKPLKPALRPRR